MGLPYAARGFTLTELMVALALLSLLATLLYPSLRGHIERARSVEAIMNLGTMARGATAYWHSPHHDERGRALPAQFPGSAEFTPRPELCAPRSQALCPGGAAVWQGATWQALGLQIPGDAYHAYGFRSEGQGDAARAAAVALRPLPDAPRPLAEPFLLCLYVFATEQRFFGSCGAAP